MPVFRFKHFTVSNSRSAMKVNTDGVLLGALMTVTGGERHLLDIGTGTGSVALMAAQRVSEASGGYEMSVEAVDIDQASADEASENFSASPWGGSMTVHHRSLSEFDCMLRSSRPEERYDLIFSNPPYFESSLKAPDQRRRTARHTDTLSYREILAFSSRRLSREGRVSMILPADMEKELVRYAASWSLYLFRIVRIRSSAAHPFSRIVVEFSRSRPSEVDAAELQIRSEGGYSPEYRSLVSDFLFI